MSDLPIPDRVQSAARHHPTYLVARGQCWATCSCGWKSNPLVNGNQPWAQLQFGQHLVDAKAVIRA